MGVQFNVNKEATSEIFRNQFGNFGNWCLKAIDSAVSATGELILGCFGKAELVKDDFKFTDFFKVEQVDSNNADENSISSALGESLASVVKVAADNLKDTVSEGIKQNDKGELKVSFGNVSLNGRFDLTVGLNEEEKEEEAADDGKLKTSFSALGQKVNIALSDPRKEKPTFQLGDIELKLGEKDGESEIRYKYSDSKTGIEFSGPVSFIADLFSSIFFKKEEEDAPAA